MKSFFDCSQDNAIALNAKNHKVCPRDDKFWPNSHGTSELCQRIWTLLNDHAAFVMGTYLIGEVVRLSVEYDGGQIEEMCGKLELSAVA